jgi:hypothetical protein
LPEASFHSWLGASFRPSLEAWFRPSPEGSFHPLPEASFHSWLGASFRPSLEALFHLSPEALSRQLRGALFHQLPEALFRLTLEVWFRPFRPWPEAWPRPWLEASFHPWLEALFHLSLGVQFHQSREASLFHQSHPWPADLPHPHQRGQCRPPVGTPECRCLRPGGFPRHHHPEELHPPEADLGQRLSALGARRPTPKPAGPPAQRRE